MFLTVCALGCGFLPSQQSESLAHLLASVHLQLRKRVDTPTSNSTYQYFTERYMTLCNLATILAT